MEDEDLCDYEEDEDEVMGDPAPLSSELSLDAAPNPTEGTRPSTVPSVNRPRPTEVRDRLERERGERSTRERSGSPSGRKAPNEAPGSSPSAVARPLPSARPSPSASSSAQTNPAPSHRKRSAPDSDPTHSELSHQSAASSKRVESSRGTDVPSSDSSLPPAKPDRRRPPQADSGGSRAIRPPPPSRKEKKPRSSNKFSGEPILIQWVAMDSSEEERLRAFILSCGLLTGPTDEEGRRGLALPDVFHSAVSSFQRIAHLGDWTTAAQRMLDDALEALSVPGVPLGAISQREMKRDVFAALRDARGNSLEDLIALSLEDSDLDFSYEAIVRATQTLVRHPLFYSEAFQNELADAAENESQKVDGVSRTDCCVKDGKLRDLDRLEEGLEGLIFAAEVGGWTFDEEGHPGHPIDTVGLGQPSASYLPNERNEKVSLLAVWEEWTGFTWERLLKVLILFLVASGSAQIDRGKTTSHHAPDAPNFLRNLVRPPVVEEALSRRKFSQETPDRWIRKFEEKSFRLDLNESAVTTQKYLKEDYKPDRMYVSGRDVGNWEETSVAHGVTNGPYRHGENKGAGVSAPSGPSLPYGDRSAAPFLEQRPLPMLGYPASNWPPTWSAGPSHPSARIEPLSGYGSDWAGPSAPATRAPTVAPVSELPPLPPPPRDNEVIPPLPPGWPASRYPQGALPALQAAGYSGTEAETYGWTGSGGARQGGQRRHGHGGGGRR